MRSKNIIMSLIIIMGIFCIIIGIIYKGSIEEKTLKASVVGVKNGYMLVAPIDSEDKISSDEILVNTADDYEIGDTVIIYYRDNIQETYPSTIEAIKIELLNRKENSVDVSMEEDENVSEDNVNNIDNNETEDKNNNVVTYSENDVVSYFDKKLVDISSYSNDSGYKEKAKAIFIDIVDFLFYDKEIKGYTFKELTNSAKLKILEIAFKIDDKINDMFPEYKAELSEKYYDSKSMIVTKYLEITADICSNNDEYCDTAKEVWATIKEKANISWSTIKKYASEGLSNLKEWYQVYSGK